MSGYTPKGDKDAYEAYQNAFEALTTLSEAGQSMRDETAAIDEQIKRAAESVESVERELIELQRKLEDVKAKKREAVANQTELTTAKRVLAERHESTLDDFNNARSTRDDARSVYLNSIEAPRESSDDLPPILGPNSGQLTVHGLGDVHGWAPGLVNYLNEHDLAEVFIDGRATSKTPEETFPDVDSVTRKGMRIEGQWMDGSTFTPIHKGSSHYRGAFGHVTVKPSKKFDRSLFLQVGDLNDRGDFSELSFVLMRKLALSTGGRALALLGNHEEMLLRCNFENWLKNESNSGEYDPTTKIGSIRIRPDLLGIKDEKQKQAYLQSLFFSYCAHYAHLLLTQEYLLRTMLREEDRRWLVDRTQPALDLLGIDDTRLEELATTETWSTLEACYEWLQKLWSEGTGLTIPGAIVVFSTGHVLALHASIKSLNEFFRTSAGADFAKTPRSTTQGSELRLHLYTMPEEKPTSIDKANQAMLWSRYGGIWGAASRIGKDIEAALDQLRRHLPHVTTVMQGHEPLSSEGLEAKVVPVKLRKNQSYALVNLDVGMTPVYLHRKVEDKYDFKRVPGGHEVATYGHDPPLLGADITVVGSGYVVDDAFIHPETEVTADIRKGDKASVRIRHLPDGRMSLATLSKEYTLITGVQERKPVEVTKGNLEVNSTYIVATKHTTWTGRVRYTPLYHVTRGTTEMNHHDALEAYNNSIEAQNQEDKLRQDEERKAEAARKKIEQQQKRDKEAARKKAEGQEKSGRTGQEGSTLAPRPKVASPLATKPATSRTSMPHPTREGANAAREAATAVSHPGQNNGLDEEPSSNKGPSAPVADQITPQPTTSSSKNRSELHQRQPVRAHVLVHIENLGTYAKDRTVADAKKAMVIQIANAFSSKFLKAPNSARCTVVALPSTIESLRGVILDKNRPLDEWVEFIEVESYQKIHEMLNGKLKSSPNYIVIQSNKHDLLTYGMNTPNRINIGQAGFMSRQWLVQTQISKAMKDIERWRDRS